MVNFRVGSGLLQGCVTKHLLQIEQIAAVFVEGFGKEAAEGVKASFGFLDADFFQDGFQLVSCIVVLYFGAVLCAEYKVMIMLFEPLT